MIGSRLTEAIFMLNGGLFSSVEINFCGRQNAADLKKKRVSQSRRLPAINSSELIQFEIGERCSSSL
jgi:hypothetical protein